MSKKLAAGVTVPAQLMRMGCTNALITYRNSGNEGVCLQSPSHGEQQLANFNPAVGDFLGLDDILEQTQAHANLSDVANYITAVSTSAGTTLYVNMVGDGSQGTAFAFLQGVQTTVAQLVANGGMKYIPDAISLMPAFNTNFTFRPDGLETVVMRAIVPSAPVQQLYNFQPTSADVIQLQNVLNPTFAAPNLSNLSSYITATQTGGNTVLSVDTTGSGHTGTAFAVIEGVQITLAQLLADNAISFTPSAVTVSAGPASNFTFRGEGNETAYINGTTLFHGAAELYGFSATNGDSLAIPAILSDIGLTSSNTNPLTNYISSVTVGGNTELFANAAGSGSGGTEFAVLNGVSTTAAALVAGNLIHY